MGGMLFGPDFDPDLLRRSGEKDEEYYSRLRTVLDPDRLGACRHLSQARAQTRWTPARKFLAVFS